MTCWDHFKQRTGEKSNEPTQHQRAHEKVYNGAKNFDQFQEKESEKVGSWTPTQAAR
jgi:hypothetical protein